MDGRMHGRAGCPFARTVVCSVSHLLEEFIGPACLHNAVEDPVLALAASSSTKAVNKPTRNDPGAHNGKAHPVSE